MKVQGECHNSVRRRRKKTNAIVVWTFNSHFLDGFTQPPKEKCGTGVKYEHVSGKKAHYSDIIICWESSNQADCCSGFRLSRFSTFKFHSFHSVLLLSRPAACLINLFFFLFFSRTLHEKVKQFTLDSVKSVRQKTTSHCDIMKYSLGSLSSGVCAHLNLL